jgi:hypothetical protein
MIWRAYLSPWMAHALVGFFGEVLCTCAGQQIDLVLTILILQSQLTYVVINYRVGEGIIRIDRHTPLQQSSHIPNRTRNIRRVRLR